MKIARVNIKQLSVLGPWVMAQIYKASSRSSIKIVIEDLGY